MIFDPSKSEGTDGEPPEVIFCDHEPFRRRIESLEAALERVNRLADEYEAQGQLTVAHFIRTRIDPPVPVPPGAPT